MSTWAAPPACAVRAYAIKLSYYGKPLGSQPKNTARTLAAGLFQHRTYKANAFTRSLIAPYHRQPKGSLQYKEEDFSSCAQGQRRRPEAMRRHQGPGLVTHWSSIGSRGPFQAGGQAPPIHQVTKSRQGEFNGIPGPYAPLPHLYPHRSNASAEL